MKVEFLRIAIKKTLWSIICLLFLFGCDTHFVDNGEILEQAFELSDTLALESLEKLELISNPNELSEAERVKYYFLKAKIYIRMGKSIDDSIFYLPIYYYKNIKDTALLYECFNLLALKNHREKEYNTSLKYLDKGQELLPFFETNKEYMFNVNWRINSLLALKKFQEAEKIAIATLPHIYSNSEKKIFVKWFTRLAQIYSSTNDIAASERNYLKILQLWKEIGNKYWQQQTFNALAQLMEKVGRYDKALGYLKQSEKLDLSRKDIPKINLIKSMLCQKRNDLDSAHYYAKIASQGGDPLIATIATSYISECFADNGEFFNAYHKRWTATQIAKSINSGISSDKSSEAFAKKELENKAKIFKIEKEKRDLLFLTVVIILLLVIIVVYLFFYRKQRKQYEVYLKNKAVQLEQENLLLNQAKEISLLREKESLLRESLFRKIDIFKKIPSIKSSKTEVESVGSIDSKKIALTENDWNELLQTINYAYPAFTRKLKDAFPLLSMADIHFCCFLKININLQDLSDIYCVSKSAIIKKKYRIKTDKLCITDGAISLDDFLKKF